MAAKSSVLGESKRTTDKSADKSVDEGSSSSSSSTSPPPISGTTQPTVEIDGRSLTIEDVVNVARRGYRVSISLDARKRMEESRQVVEDIIKNTDAKVYGINTGFGIYADKTLTIDKIEELNRNLIVSHAVGLGEPLPIDVCKATLLVRANTLCCGKSGVRPLVVETMVRMINEDLVPILPSLGSLAASGDLCLLSHMCLVFTGPPLGPDGVEVKEEGNPDCPVMYKGTRMRGKDAMKLAGIPKIILGAKEGLGANNGATVTCAMACLNLADSEYLLKSANAALSLSMEALMAVPGAFDERIHKARNHEGQVEVARQVRQLTEGSSLISSKNRVQDPYSIRCAPQVHGAVELKLHQIRDVVSNELNAVTDNPLVFAKGEGKGEIISGGNFHGELLGFEMDNLKVLISELGAISERRIARLTDDKLSNGLPCMLTDPKAEQGLCSSLMIPHYSAVSLSGESCALAHPNTTYSMPTSAGYEDFNSNAMTAARHAYRVVRNTEKIIGIELFCASRGTHIRLGMIEDAKTTTTPVVSDTLSSKETKEKETTEPVAPAESKDEKTSKSALKKAAKLKFKAEQKASRQGKSVGTRGISLPVEPTKISLLGKGTTQIYSTVTDAAPYVVKDYYMKTALDKLAELIASDKWKSDLDRLIKESFELSGGRKNISLTPPAGTQDFGPAEMKVRNKFFSTVRKIFEIHGGQELDTPAFEKKEVLFGQYGEENQKLVFDLVDQGQMLSLKYDLTIPLCRYLALTNKTRMKRFHMAKVWRRDNPSLERGRCREFTQCDFDCVGEGKLMLADAECICVFHDALKALDFGDFRIDINHRKLLGGLLELCGLSPGAENFGKACSSIDKLDKQPWSEVSMELIAKGLSTDVVEKIGKLMPIMGPCREILSLLQAREDLKDSKSVQEALSELAVLFDYLDSFNCLDKCVFSLSLARGISYYDGVVVEAKQVSSGLAVGSIGGGGRYNGLIGQFRSDGKKVPAMGVSLGVERIMALMQEKEKMTSRESYAKVLIHTIDEKCFIPGLKICRSLWDAGIPAEVRQEAKLDMKNQIEYCLDNKIPWLIIIGSKELKDGKVKIKSMKSKEELEALKAKGKEKEETEVLVSCEAVATHLGLVLGEKFL